MKTLFRNLLIASELGLLNASLLPLLLALSFKESKRSEIRHFFFKFNTFLQLIKTKLSDM